MAHRGRLLLAGALTALLVACQPASAAPGRPANNPSGEQAAAKPAAEPAGQAAGQPAASTGGQTAARPADPAAPARQAGGEVPRIAVQQVLSGFDRPLY